ncbi:MAG TPA: class I SAM-dependent methyltransferase [Candidatus Babeliales bacterium]|nr:class I SAM-dependent methyltransferase [Candidatus Babeliales bacterium]
MRPVKEQRQSYQKLLRKNIELSGAQESFFAEYKAIKLTQWFPQLLTTPHTILDFGCGDGIMTSFVQALCPQATIYGIDASLEHIEVAQMAYENITFIHSDAPKIPFADSSFDLIYAADIFHHLPKNQHESYCAEIYRILKPNGTFVMLELNPLNLMTAYRFMQNPMEKDASMLWPWYTKKLLHTEYAAVSLQFYGFFPNKLKRLEFLEAYMGKLPFGSLYICKGYKN